MTARAVALLSGGLDSMLAVRILQDQGVKVEAINFQTTFSCCKGTAGRAARESSVPLTVLSLGDDDIELIRRPRFGYGKGANPCLDCRIHMFRRVTGLMREFGAAMVVSGEVVGQRPMSQKRRDLGIIARASGLDGLLLRPLSARLLPPTLPERSGQVDRHRLFAFRGRGRKELIALARYYGFQGIPTPSSGCPLTEESFAGRVLDLIKMDARSSRWDFELLKVGRHLRMDNRTKAVVGRRAAENEALEHMYRQADSRADALLVPKTFAGPSVVLVGPPTAEALQFAGGLVLRFAKGYDPEQTMVHCDVLGQDRLMLVRHNARATAAATL